jgi:hypothetical protein
MSKTTDPTIPETVPEPLLAAVDRAQAGRWIAISSLDSTRAQGIVGGASLERLVAALFSVLPISANTDSPLLGWIADASDEASIDAFYTVQGTARDSERRSFEMQVLPTIPDEVWEDVDAVITVDSTEDYVFFVCVGGAPHAVVDLTRDRGLRAA